MAFSKRFAQPQAFANGSLCLGSEEIFNLIQAVRRYYATPSLAKGSYWNGARRITRFFPDRFRLVHKRLSKISQRRSTQWHLAGLRRPFGYTRGCWQLLCGGGHARL